ncbi:helix-turn-helix transcriptional regulator [Streptococcus pneumoniae]
MNNIKNLRKNKNMTQQELADFLEIKKRTLQRWEANEVTIKNDKAQQLADYFDVSVAYLLGYEEKVVPLEEFVKNMTNTRDEDGIEYGDHQTILETELITNFRQMDIEKQENLVRYSEFLLTSKKGN